MKFKKVKARQNGKDFQQSPFLTFLMLMRGRIAVAGSAMIAALLKPTVL